MKEIHKGIEIFEKLLDKQKIKINIKYRSSVYVRKIEYDNKFLLYNFFTKKFVILENEEINEYKQLPQYPNKYLSKLIEEWFLVPVDFDEHKFADAVNDTYNLLTQSCDAITLYTIVTTSACNARCFYCFEKGARIATMNNETINKTVEFILNKSKRKQVKISWFGGEPLINIKAIDLISKRLQDNDVSFVSTITTNGYLFDESIVKRAKNLWNLRSVQITLDGTEKIYNATKNYVGQQPFSPFVKVINNIELLAINDIRVSIRLNVSKENFNDMIELVDFLDKKFSKYKKYIKVYAVNLFEDESLLSFDEQTARNDRLLTIKNLIFSKQLGYKENNLERILKTIPRSCMAESADAVVISPTGKLSRCDNKFEDSDAYGSIFDDNIDKKKYNYWLERRKIPECDNCPFSAHCSGINHCPNSFEKCNQNYINNNLRQIDKFLIQVYNESFKANEDV